MSKKHKKKQKIRWEDGWMHAWDAFKAADNPKLAERYRRLAIKALGGKI